MAQDKEKIEEEKFQFTAEDEDLGYISLDQAIYRRPLTSKPGPGHKVYPYLLGGMEITRPNSFPGGGTQGNEHRPESNGGHH